jgi:DNA-binding response OmpR family regulator
LNREILTRHLQKEEYLISTANNGEEAWELMLNSPPQTLDTVLLDRMMPGIDGLEVLRRMKAHDELKNVPVIFQTAMTGEDEILEGIQAGAYYYLTKPYRRERLLAVVKAAISGYIQYRTLQKQVHQTVNALHYLDRAEFSIQRLDEADDLASLLAKMCPEPDKVVLGIWELLINAVEHGNLAITYEEKSDLLNRNAWRDEVERRMLLPEYRDRKVLVQFENSATGYVITIEDMGPGFKWESFMDFSADRALDAHGRGIAIAGAYSFSRLEYLGRGNIVKATISREKT